VVIEYADNLPVAAGADAAPDQYNNILTFEHSLVQTEAFPD
jgi:hypothetical protein